MAPISRTEVIKSLQNQTLTIRGLHSAFANWPFRVNCYLNQVRQDVALMLTSRFPHHPKLRKLIGGDYGLFGAAWWPCAGYEQLLVATYLSMWVRHSLVPRTSYRHRFNVQKAFHVGRW
ncbi:hypothetical protein BO78DRAFT_137943 [Aspergillus sclerotiicarbonarius CBS 121057]|uniref:Uncharacterized protein n=1 Tax=Aspergillus sclerotiicarbonarius (strain CBS 121057 / IBT 28362) TaxID=1448318 RepID=A0A319EVQ3_ASPSB|nr:hypothetical protein BO78DRAFT_137943 [Aspergillus sclerotiicarbonarius CBS 121057]